MGNPVSGDRKNRAFFAVFGFILLLGFVLLALSSLQRTVPALVHPPSASSNVGDAGGLARTPPMGWNSWNKFQCEVNDSLIRQVADAMVSSGMRDAGYEYVIIDDCWMTARREKGHLQPDPATFPYGIKPLADYVHSRGLKFGLYSDRGTRTCQGRAASHGHERTDARDFAEWGVDYLKYDNCNPAFLSVREWDYRRMRRALDASGRPIVFSICTWGNFREWMPSTGHLWRTGGDIGDNWNSMIGQIGPGEELARYAGPGRWNDPDMLEVGNGGMTADEYRAHFSLWAVLAAPLIAGNDVRGMSQATRDILLNKEVIAVDQDPLGRQGTKVWEENGMVVYSKVLQEEGARAVVLLNLTDRVKFITAGWRTLDLPETPSTVRDLWKHADLGSFRKGYNAEVPAHGAVMLKVVSTSR